MSNVKKRPAKLYHPENVPDDDWQPSAGVVIKLLLSVRISAALWSSIDTKTEVFGFYEGLHRLLYGDGFNTWELLDNTNYYSRVFLIWIYSIPASIFVNCFGDSKIVVFTCVRLMTGLLCLLGEYYAFYAISKRINVATGRYFLLFTILSPGMFHASVTFSDLSFTMICTFYFIAAFLDEQWVVCIISLLFAVFFGTPFIFVLGVVLTHATALKKEIFKWTGVFMCLCMIFSLVRLRVVASQLRTLPEYEAPLGHNNTGYEHATINPYKENLFFNWNFAIFYAFVGFVLSYKTFTKFRLPSNYEKRLFLPKERNLLIDYLPILHCAFIVFMWSLVFGLPSTEEEHIAFPMYPFISLFAALAADSMLRLFFDKTKKLENNMYKNMLYSSIGLFALFSVMRSFSVYHSYGSHVEIYKGLHQELNAHEEFDRFNDPITLCIGKEWQYFPSSFFLPERVYDGKLNPRKFQMRFLQSAYNCSLQTKYAVVNNTTDTSIDENRRPTINNSLEFCDYVIDMDMPATEKEPNFGNMAEKWKPILSLPVIDANQSDMFFKNFYLPVFAGTLNKYTTCTLYRKKIT
ncbi:hypothetical protein GCK72_005497 [Caenorhabditis remanei]|uniref:Mannosyltransferase n=1 Tax=Caenorhabditis remanei TaxID=31234 RepID=A0A6A5HDY2_CAERE|nr:hypothetical protein GCK72_005497 [Caenorhabditis remanei]KAF1765545.1 hypothetical protein GCK72_005497 [Caenorhabditis remanei]